MKEKMGYTTRSLAGMVLRAWEGFGTRCSKNAPWRLGRKTPAPYMLSDEAKERFFVPLQREQHFYPPKHVQLLQIVQKPLNGFQAIQHKAFDISPAKKDSMRYLTHLPFECLPMKVLKYAIYWHWETWSGMGKYQFKGQQFLQEFKGCLDPVLSLHWPDWPQPQALRVVKLGKDGNLQPAKQRSGDVAQYYTSRAIVYSQIQQSELENTLACNVAHTMVESGDRASK